MPPKKGVSRKRKIDSLPLHPTGELLPPTFTATAKKIIAPPPRGGNSKERKAEIIIAGLLGGRTIDDAAKLAGMDKRTVHLYLASPWFQERFAAAKKNLLDETIANLRGFATGAVQGLNEILTDRTVAPLARVSAGREILQAMLRAVELEDVVGQIEELKRAVAESKEGGL